MHFDGLGLFVWVLLWKPAVLPPDMAAAHRAEQAHDFAGAELIYEQLLKNGPDSAVYQRLGLVRHMQNKFDSAAQAFGDAVKLDSSSWPSQLFLGIDLYRTDHFSEAEEHLSQANRLQPNQPEALFWLGATKLARRKYLQGFSTLESLLTRDPQNTEALRMLAEGYAEYGTSLLNEVGNQHPDSPAGLAAQARASEFSGDFRHALELFRAAQAADPHRAGLQEDIQRVQSRTVGAERFPQSATQ